MDHTIEAAYAMAKQGVWDVLLSEWDENSLFGRECAHYKKPTSGWTFLHQAAFFGDETACRELIRLGASVGDETIEKQTPADVADSRGHTSIAGMLREATTTSLWVAPYDASMYPSSSRWEEAIERRATEDFEVSYGGGRVSVRVGDRYYVDSFERILVGWHGSTDPPKGMDTESLID